LHFCAEVDRINLEFTADGPLNGLACVQRERDFDRVLLTELVLNLGVAGVSLQVLRAANLSDRFDSGDEGPICGFLAVILHFNLGHLLEEIGDIDVFGGFVGDFGNQLAA
jgi:hypothetical protein